MSDYHIGQFRSSQISTYMTPLTINITRMQSASENVENVVFRNPCGKLSGLNTINNDNCYYLKFQVGQRTDGVQNFVVKLLNSTLTKNNTQQIGSFSTPAGSSTSYYELVFQPNASYDTIVFELRRIALDYQFTNLNNTFGRIMNINSIELNKLINVIDYLKESYHDLKYLKKIGIQGPSGLLMCINGEQVRIGKNRIYEISNNYKINFISFIINNDFFIMDFQY